jgi:hypothetical protein
VPLVEEEWEMTSLDKAWNISTRDLPETFIFGNLCERGMSVDMALVVVGIRRYEEAVNDLLDGFMRHLDTAQLCDRRNLIQHTVMSLPPSEESIKAKSTGIIHESFRLALMIYCLTVIFPLPTQTAMEPLAKLSGDLKAILECDSDFKSWTERSAQLLLWILVIGGVVARDRRDDRAWWVACLRRRTANDITDFEDLKAKVLTEFVWLERSCDAAGEMLWSEVCQERGYQKCLIKEELHITRR